MSIALSDRLFEPGRWISPFALIFGERVRVFIMIVSL